MGRLFVVLFVAVLLSFDVVADDSPTIVYGAAETDSGGQNVFVVDQQKNAPNPLGNPIPTPNKPVEVFGDVYPQDTNQTEKTKQSQDNQSQQNLGNDFENTLLEANGRVYDVQ